MRIKIEINEGDVKQLILNEIARKLGDIPFDKTKVVIETKSKQNYKSEWEVADFRVSYSAVT